MREFVYFSGKAVTTGNFKDLMKAGRMDIVCHFVVNSFFVSNKAREDVILHLFFYGPPDPPKHLEISWNENISKKDVIGLIKRMLYKYKKGKRTEAFPGCSIEKKSLLGFVEELEARNVYLLERKGSNIREAEIGENPVFIIGDHEGFPQKEARRIRKTCSSVSLGKTTYFASQTLTILQNEMDFRGL